MAAEPDLTLRALRAELDERGVKASYSALWLLLTREGLTFRAALRHDRIDALCVLDGAINGESVLAYVEQFLLPTLTPGDVVIMDNLGSHKSQAVRRAIRSAGPQSDRAGLRQAQNAAPKSAECANYLANSGFASS